MMDDLLEIEDRTEQTRDGFNLNLCVHGRLGMLSILFYRKTLMGMRNGRGLGIYVVLRPWNRRWWPRDSPVRRQQGLVTARKYMTLPGSVVPLSLLNEKEERS